ncbi:MAG TPA: hypothetical protein VK666_29340 [Chryseolinea sp.]|nr:hypothetical protein [Chryseolinea sp.]
MILLQGTNDNETMLVLNQMKLLISLAQIDGVLAPKERNYITNIARANNIYPDQIEPLFEKTHHLVLPQDLTNDEKFNYLFSMVQLMKIDERMYKEELMFCRKMAEHLGYEPQALFELLLNVKTGPMSDQETDGLKQLVQQYLKTS